MYSVNNIKGLVRESHRNYSVKLSTIYMNEIKFLHHARG